MSKKCPNCGSRKVDIDCGLNICQKCNKAWKAVPRKKPTVFNRITADEETLAEEFVEMMYDRVAGDYRYYSMLIGEFYNNREEAIAATVARLKEVEK